MLSRRILNAQKAILSIFRHFYFFPFIFESFPNYRVSKKMSLLSGFEFLTLREAFLVVVFHQKQSLFYKIFSCLSKIWRNLPLIAEK